MTRFPNRLILIALSLFAVVTISILPAEEGTEGTGGKSDSARIVAMLEAYQNLMIVPLDQTAEDPAGKTWATIQNAIKEGYLRFSVDPTGKNIVDGAIFQTQAGTETAYVVINTALLDQWEIRPAMAYTVLSRVFQDAYGFFVDPQAWSIAQVDLADNFTLRIKAYETAALLVRNRLKQSNLELGAYENYILESYEKDGLVSVSLFLERMSLPVAEAMEQLRMAYELDGDSESLRAAILELGEALLEIRDAADSVDNIADGTTSADAPVVPSDDRIYPRAVAVHTWLELTPWMISRIHNRDSKTEPLRFDEVLKLESDYARLRRMLEARRIVDMPMINYIYNANIRGFETR